MIKTRLIGLLSHAKKYVAFQVLWKWFSLLCQVLMISAACALLESAVYGEMTAKKMLLCGGMVLIAMLLRFFFDRQASYASYQAILWKFE